MLVSKLELRYQDLSKLPDITARESEGEEELSLLDWVRIKLSRPVHNPPAASASDQGGTSGMGDFDDAQNSFDDSRIPDNEDRNNQDLPSTPFLMKIQMRLQNDPDLDISIKSEQSESGQSKLLVTLTGEDVGEFSVVAVDDSGKPIENNVIYRTTNLGGRNFWGNNTTRYLFNGIQIKNIFGKSTFFFILALVCYLFTRVIGLEDFPIYFFTDEAVHTILAEELVQNGFQYNGEFLPIYFPFGSSYGLNSVTVYLQLIPYILFGKSIFVTRITAVLITLLGATAIGFILKDFFKSPYWWSAVLVLSVTPTWFLHSRTAFENVSVAAFYACFLYFYLRYRLVSPKAIFPAILFGGLVFYSHGLGQFLMASSGILLSISDFRYHLKNRKIVLGGFLFLVLIFYPYFRFYFEYPGIFEEQLAQRGSYWTNNSISSIEKAVRFLGTYLSGFNPLYWFNPDPGVDLDRHVMKGYGHLLMPSFVFLLLGLVNSIKKIRAPEHRTLLIAFIASPFGAAFTQVTILRTIWFVVPVTIFITLGISYLLEKIESRKVTRLVLNYSLLVVLVGLNLFMLADSLMNGPLWYRDYTLYGMQYGAKQLFEQTIPDVLEEWPSSRIVLSPSWANGTDNFKEFFLSEEYKDRVSFNTIDAYLYERLPIDDDLILILTPDEYQQAITDRKIAKVELLMTVAYPDGRPGFYYSKIRYAEDADRIFEEEKEARKELIESRVNFSGVELLIKHSVLDMGSPVEIFDGNLKSLIRGLEANPFIIDIFFPDAFEISGIAADFAHMDFSVKAILYSDQDAGPKEFEKTIRGVEGDPHFVMSFGETPNTIDRLRLEIYSLSHGERAHIHVRELNFVK